jgi:hypothetical protein
VRVCAAPADTVDHIQPRSRGGRSRVDNLTGMCLEHNREKDDESLLWFLVASTWDIGVNGVSASLGDTY